MLQLTNLETSRPKRLFTVIVVAAVCALAISVATRYGYSQGPSVSAVTQITNHASSEPSRPRLINSAVTWIPAVTGYTLLEAPTPYARVAPEAPPILTTFFDQSLSNRPPPQPSSFA